LTKYLKSISKNLVGKKPLPKRFKKLAFLIESLTAAVLSFGVWENAKLTLNKNIVVHKNRVEVYLCFNIQTKNDPK